MNELDLYFQFRCQKGLSLRQLQGKKEYEDRLQYEIKVISEMGFSGYFLIVSDIVRWAINNGVPVGPGRGCLTGEVPVITEGGQSTPIRDIKLGDRVISLTGEVKDVLEKYKYNVEENLITIKTYYGDYIGITLTEDHKVFAQNAQETDRYQKYKDKAYKNKIKRWTKPTQKIYEIPAGALSVGDWVFTPLPKRNVKIPPATIDLSSYQNEGGVEIIERNGLLIEARNRNKPYDFSIRDVGRQTGVDRHYLSKICCGQIVPDNTKNAQQRESLLKVYNYIGSQFDSVNEWASYVNCRKREYSSVKREIILNDDFYWIIGKWAADGWFRKSNDNLWGICFHRQEQKQINRVCRWLTLHNIDYLIQQHATKQLTQLTVHVPIFVKWWRTLFGSYRYTSQTKHLPLFLTSLPKDKLKLILQGLIDGDGYTEKNRVRIATTSRALADQTRYILCCLKVPSSLRLEERLDPRPDWPDHENYVVEFQLSPEKTYKWHPHPDGFWIQIKEVSKRHYNGWVYDLKVQDNPSYLTTSGLVHNSAGGSLVAYVLEITHLDPIKYKLIFERFLNPGRLGPPFIEVEEISFEKFHQNILPTIDPDIVLLKNHITRNEFASLATDEWELLSQEQKTYISYLVHKNIKNQTNQSNSWVLYCLGITEEKPSGALTRKGGGGLCDIDLDFCKENRHRVLEYVIQKYGEDKVAHIGTYTTMQAKSAIRDVARTLGFEYQLGDKLSRLVLPPIEGKNQTLDICYEKVSELKNIKNGGPSQEKEVLSWSDRIEGRLKAFSTHASGVVISNEPITNIMPLYKGKDGTAATQYDMNTVEELGLIKFDFLGLDALTTIKRCVDSVSKRHGIDIDPLKIPVDDQETYENLRAGSVEGVFQLEGSSGLRDLLVQIRPTCLEDIALLVALYRPGPLGSNMLKHYLQVRAGETTPNFLVPELEPILGETGGMLIYQEQILEICKQMAGYTMSQADLMRRAVGKKKQDLMDIEHPKFIDGMMAAGFSQQVADQIWNDINVFAGYGFNRSHAACYGYISYQMAWLKTHYPVDFMCSCLVSDSGNVEKTIRYINECKRLGIEILPPSINQSENIFSITTDNNIRFGLEAIKNIGKPVTELVRNRKKHGSFKGIIDLSERVNLSKFNKKKLQCLVLAGALDDIGQHSRASLMGAIDSIGDYRAKVKAWASKDETYRKKMMAYEIRMQEIEAYTNLSKEERKGKKRPGKIKLPVKPDMPEKPTIPDIEEYPIKERLAHEKDLLGYYLSGHPLDRVHILNNQTIQYVKEFGYHKQFTRVVALPSVVKEQTSKKSKKKFAFLTLEDKTGTISAVIWPNSYAECKPYIDATLPSMYTGRLEVTEGDDKKVYKLLVSEIMPLQPAVVPEDKYLNMNIRSSQLLEVADYLKNHRGDHSTVNLQIDTTTGNRWDFGEINSSSKTKEILLYLKEIGK